MGNWNLGIQSPGQVIVEQLQLVGSNGIFTDLNPFLVEFNLYEDIFNTFLHGDILLTDSRNLVEKLPILGEELLLVKFTTPTIEYSIEKSFKVYALSDRDIVKDNSTQNFTLKFVSQEAFVDMNVPLYLPFNGKIHEIVSKIYSQYLSVPRKYILENNTKSSDNKITPLQILETDNSAKFVSPGWSPSKCINWLASNSVPATSTAKNYIFFETNKKFYFITIENLIKKALETNNVAGPYVYSPATKNDLSKAFFNIQSLKMADGLDSAKTNTGGHLANRNILLDIVNKNYKILDYYHTDEYNNQYHTSGKTGKPPWPSDLRGNPLSHISVRTTNPFLFSGGRGVDGSYENVKGNRLSSLQDLNTIKLNITIPGRTDMEAGQMMNVRYPSLGQSSDTEALDTLYSGNYLITAIHHKVTRNNHFMTMEIVKDSLSSGDNS